MNKIFYRYIRPLHFNTKRLEFDTWSNGGICLRFEQSLTGTLFTYSRCHIEDHFNKSVAKHIADRRAVIAKSDDRLLSLMSPDMSDIAEDAKSLAAFVTAYCRAFNPQDTSYLVGHYLSSEWKGFADALESIIKHNEKQAEIAHTWITAAQAVKTVAFYTSQAGLPVEDEQ